MKCPQCGAANPDDAFFCGECGAKIRSLMSQPVGPVDEIGGEIEIEPLTTDLVKVRSEPEPPAPEPAAPGPPAAELPAGEPPPDAPAPKPPSPPPPRPPDVHAPGAGLVPPAGGPPPPGQQPPGGYAPPPPGSAPAGTYPPATPAYGYQLPPDGNTSGMGAGYPAPPVASGWTFAGCIPFGLFAFVNGSIAWGLIALLGGFLPYVGGLAGLVYFIYIGVQGRELAWRGRRFESVQHYAATMGAWNTWGIIIGLVLVGLSALVVVLWMVLFATMFAAGVQ